MDDVGSASSPCVDLPEMKALSNPLTPQLQRTVYPILFTVSMTHLLNDLLQAVIPATYPLLKQNYHLSFSQVGLITFAFQLMASLLQPFIGSYTDKRPKPFSFAVGMCFTMA
ncbi:MAG: major facilitator superfamily 1, partial [Flaviaesturariibacter sp.]|nr:major facilitator superfamily 1 [Flaviaesturariibacter sp.]